MRRGEIRRLELEIVINRWMENSGWWMVDGGYKCLGIYIV